MLIKIGKEENAVVEVSGQDVYKYINNTYACINAKTLLNHFKELEDIPITSMRDSYVIESHNSRNFILPEKEENFRLEEWTCKNMVINYPTVGEGKTCFGRLVGYQIPIKAPDLIDKSKNAGLGKIDMLSVNDETAFILELKVEDSTEHPLRAFLEAYTYWKLLGGDDAKKFLAKSDAKNAKKLDKAVVFYKNSCIHNKMKNMDDDMKELIIKLGVSCFLVGEKEQGNSEGSNSKKHRITFVDVEKEDCIDKNS
ncbi:MAG: hypothetical protein PHT84_00100 [Candidatus Pacebacteria bacterium]|nr:hypothetical protein [Candidatus Paceibacterota bacterium]